MANFSLISPYLAYYYIHIDITCHIFFLFDSTGCFFLADLTSRVPFAALSPTYHPPVRGYPARPVLLRWVKSGTALYINCTVFSSLEYPETLRRLRSSINFPIYFFSLEVEIRSVIQSALDYIHHSVHSRFPIGLSSSRSFHAIEAQ